MEHLLQKMAHQLDTLDEASLMSLWDKYATIVCQFEPSRRWEEAVLVFGLIQAKHWKNQLFNHKLAASSKPAALRPTEQTHAFQHKRQQEANTASPSGTHSTKDTSAPRRATIIPFVPRTQRTADQESPQAPSSSPTE